MGNNGKPLYVALAQTKEERMAKPQQGLVMPHMMQQQQRRYYNPHMIRGGMAGGPMFAMMGNNRGGRGRGRGGGRGNRKGGPSNFKYTANARNHMQGGPQMVQMS